MRYPEDVRWKSGRRTRSGNRLNFTPIVDRAVSRRIPTMEFAMAIHPLDITPENEAEAVAERAAVRASRSLGVASWIGGFLGVSGLVSAFIAACILSGGASRLEGLGDLLHGAAKVLLLASLAVFFLGYRMKESSRDQLIDAVLVDRPDLSQLWLSNSKPMDVDLPISRPAWNGPTNGSTATHPFHSLMGQPSSSSHDPARKETRR